MLKKILLILLFVVWRLLRWSYRFHYRGLDHLAQAKSHHPAGSYALACWHEQILAATTANLAENRYAILISKSKDGDYAASVAESLGHKVVRGSSSRGGEEARQLLLQEMKQLPIALTVDGPRGPRQRCKPGIVRLSQLAQTAVVPIAVIGKRNFVFHKSWDHFRFPWPFTEIVWRYGTPIPIPAQMSEEEFDAHLRRVEQGLAETLLLVERDLAEL